MSMIPDIDDDRWSQGMSTERYHPWHGDSLEPQPVSGAEGIAGRVAIIVHLGPEGGMAYEETEPVGENWHRARFSNAIPNQVRKS